VLREALASNDTQVTHLDLYWHERFHKEPMCAGIREQLKAFHASAADEQ
jgi:hypothetical protein